ncbi:Integrase catalytic domain-containing protein [Durusdinium trenchii]|uniref:Integrase catalytic domain-containing protein n=1 Tax=Durusdinium trenchii TaxID=1381693 RepID=A0ABP0LW20_9DINO
MDGSAPSTVSGLPLQEYRKDVPPGWAPNIPDYPLKLYFERLRVWYRLFEGPDETVGPLMAGRLQGRAQQIALQLRLPDPLGNVDVGDSALVRLAVDEVRDPAQPHIILQHAIPSGVQALTNALREAFGDSAQLQSTKALEAFFDFRKQKLTLQEFSVEWTLRLEEAMKHAGLELNNVAKTFLFFRNGTSPEHENIPERRDYASTSGGNWPEPDTSWDYYDSYDTGLNYHTQYYQMEDSWTDDTWDSPDAWQIWFDDDNGECVWPDYAEWPEGEEHYDDWYQQPDEPQEAPEETNDYYKGKGKGQGYRTSGSFGNIGYGKFGQYGKGKNKGKSYYDYTFATKKENDLYGSPLRQHRLLRHAREGIALTPERPTTSERQEAHFGDNNEIVETFHMIQGVKRRGLLVDPGAAAGLIGSETLRDIMENCIKPQGLETGVERREKQTSVTGISGKGDQTMAEISFPFKLDSKQQARYSADVLGGEGSLCKFPADLRTLSLRRKTTAHYLDDTSEIVNDKWNNDVSLQAPLSKKWTGFTEFFYKTDDDQDSPPATDMRENKNYHTEYFDLMDHNDHWFTEEEVQEYEGDHFPSHISEEKRTYLKKMYRAIPEEFYTHLKVSPVTPDNVKQWMDRVSNKNRQKKKWCSGSARLTLLAFLSGMCVLFPVDMRYGWDIGHPPHQKLLREVQEQFAPDTLMMSPNCRPWSVSSNKREPEVIQRERQAEMPCVKFCKESAVKQCQQKKHYVLEQPWSSALWHELHDMPGHPQRTDQCQFGAEDEEHRPILKPTGLLSDAPLHHVLRRCGGHAGPHGWLQGQVQGKNRTTLAAVYPKKFCNALLKDIRKWSTTMTQTYYECPKCKEGRWSIEEHTLIPGQCRHGKWPEGFGPKGKIPVPDLVADFKQEALNNKKVQKAPLGTLPNFDMDQEQVALFKYCMITILKDSADDFESQEKSGKKEVDYARWSTNPVILSWLRKVLEDKMTV